MAPLFGIGKAKKRHEQELLERDRLQQERDQQHREQLKQQKENERREIELREERERHYREQLRIQQKDNERRERELQEHVRRMEREEEDRLVAMQMYEEQLRREQENRRLLKEQAKRKQRERENERLAHLRQTTPEALRDLRDLIRQRYELDIMIWGLRGVKQVDHEDVIKMGRKADAVLDKIHGIVDTWEGKSGNWTAEEWKVAKKIKDYLKLDGKRKWENNPPWNDPY